jgi:Arc/MetJ-type ribon-helix-helix transcriptional regulator
MSIQIALRLPESMVEFIDSLVADGRATSRADVVSRALQREQRRELAARDAAIMAADPDPDLARLSEYVSGLPLDID